MKAQGKYRAGGEHDIPRGLTKALGDLLRDNMKTKMTNYTSVAFSHANKALTALRVTNDMDFDGVANFLRTNMAAHDAHRYTDEEIGNVGQNRISEGQLCMGLAYARHFFLEQEGEVVWVRTSKHGYPKDRISEIGVGVMDPFAQYLAENRLEAGFKDVASLALFALGVRIDTSPAAVRFLLHGADIDSLSFEPKERGEWTTDLAMKAALTHVLECFS